MELVPEVGQVGRVAPLVVAARAHVVEVVVEAVAAGPRGLGRVGVLADVAPVVVRQYDGDVVRGPQPAVPVPLDLLVERPHLADRGRVAARHLGDDRPLRVDDLPHQLDAVAVRQAGVAVPAHPEGDDALEVLVGHPADAVAPVHLERVGVAAERPLPRTAVRVMAGRDDGSGAVAHGGYRVPVPLLDAPHHGRLVRRAHDNPILLGAGVLRGSSSAKARPHTAGHR